MNGKNAAFAFFHVRIELLGVSSNGETSLEVLLTLFPSESVLSDISVFDFDAVLCPL